MFCAMEIGMRVVKMIVVHLVCVLARRRIPYAEVLNVGKAMKKK